MRRGPYPDSHSSLKGILDARKYAAKELTNCQVLLGATSQSPKILPLSRELQAWVLAPTQSWMLITPERKSATTQVVPTTLARIASTMINTVPIAPKARKTCARNVTSIAKSVRTASMIVLPNVVSRLMSVKKPPASSQITMLHRAPIISTVIATWQRCLDPMHGHLTTPWVCIMDTSIRRFSTQG